MEQSLELKKKTVSGVGSLVLRNVFMQPISFFGFVLLSVYLQTWELGVFWAVSEIVGFLGYFSDVGLAAAVIQKREEPKREELRATFTLQQILVLASIVIALALTPVLKNKFDFQNGQFLYDALLFSFFASSLKTIPSVLLERQLKFEKIAVVDLVEQVTFTGLAVFLAFRGFGVNSWAWAVMIRSLLGLIVIWQLSPWPLGISFDFKRVKHLLRFGVPFQVNSLLAMVKDRLVNIFLWGILGSTGVGILGWAQRWAQIPLRILMDSVIRVTFPAYAKMQHDRLQLKRALERSVFSLNLILFPVFAGMAFLMPKIVLLFPKYAKWSVGIVPFWLYLGSFCWGAVTTPLVNAFNSVGKVKISLKLMLLWTALTWILTPFLAKKFGVNGAAWSLFLVSSTSLVAWWAAQREFRISFGRILTFPLLGSLVMWLFLRLVSLFLPLTLLSLFAYVIFGALAYGLLMWWLAKADILWLIKTFREWLNRKK